MIIREWRGRASRSRAEAYPKHFRDNVAPKLRQVPGFLGAHLCQRKLDDEIEFLVITRWQSMEAIGAFAGADVEKAIVEPGAVAALVTYDAVVRHYEAIEEVLAQE
jgi:heme-degrading monooxygenase HmoA